MIKIDFEFETEKYGVYRDALILSEDHGLTDQEIEDMKTQRLNNWLSIIEAPRDEVPDVEPAPLPTLNIAGEEYALLDGAPSSGQTLIEVNGHWYYKVQ